MLEGRRATHGGSLEPSGIRRTKRVWITHSSNYLNRVTRLKQETTSLPARELSYREKIYQSARVGWGPKEKQVIKHIYSLGKAWSPPFSSLLPQFFTLILFHYPSSVGPSIPISSWPRLLSP